MYDIPNNLVASYMYLELDGKITTNSMYDRYCVEWSNEFDLPLH